MATRTPPHGNRNRYNAGCRCTPCREAARIYHKRLREGRLQPGWIDHTGTSRRLQALAAHGYTFRELGNHLGTDERWPSILAHTNRRVTRSTAARVKAVYDQLSATPGTSAYTQTWAGKHGWHPPDAWSDDTIDDPTAQPYGDLPVNVVDEIAIERVEKGHMPFGELHPADQVELYRRLRERGLADGQIRYRHQLSIGAVTKLRQAASLDAQEANAA